MIKMKTIYIKPESEVVIVKLVGSVLGGLNENGASKPSDEQLSKKNNLIFDNEEEGEASQSTNIWDK